MTDHSEILPRLAAYHDGALPDDEYAAIRQHLDRCAECRARLNEWTALDSALKSLATPEPSATALAAAALRRIEAGGRVEFTPSLRGPAAPRWKIWAGAAAAILVLAVSAAIWQGTTRGTSGEGDLALVPTRNDATSPEPPAFTDEAIVAKDEPAADTDLPTRRAQLTEPGAAPPDRNPSDAYGQTAARNGDRDRETRAIATAPASIRSEDSGIPQDPDWPARSAFYVDIHYRFYDRIDAAYVELNVVPVFEVDFAPVGYARLEVLSDRWDVANLEPTLLSPEDTYLVSNLRLERSTLLSLVTNQAPTSEVRYRLAEVTWRLANITADQDDVRSAISAQSEVLRQDPEIGTQSRARLAYLRGLVR